MSTLDDIKARVKDHTPGPWGVYDANEGTTANPMWCVANDAFHNPPADGDEPWIAVEVYVGGKEDAVLIAVAPKLLAALEAVEGMTGKLLDSSDSPPGQDDFNKGIDQGFAIAAKAIRSAIEEALS